MVVVTAKDVPGGGSLSLDKGPPLPYWTGDFGFSGRVYARVLVESMYRESKKQT